MVKEEVPDSKEKPYGEGSLSKSLSAVWALNGKHSIESGPSVQGRMPDL